MRGGDQRAAGDSGCSPSGPSSSTQVSFEPPPCDELTIIEPSRSATRVSPPGTIRMSSPNTANGRRSTWRGASAPSGARGRHRRQPHQLLRDPALRLPEHLLGLALDLLLVRRRPDEDALAARLARRLDHHLVEPLEHPGALLGVGHQVGRHVVEDRLLAEVVADHLGHVVVDRLVVGHAGADRVDDRDAAGPVRAHQPRHAEHRVGPELERVHEVVVDPAVDRVHALEPARGAHVADRVAHDEVRRLDQLDAHLPRQERVLEVGGVERARRPHDHRRLLLPAGRRHLRERGPQQRRVVVDRPHAVVGEQPGQQPRHRHPVLEHVRDPARRAHVVLEHLPRAVAVAHEVAARHVGVHAAGRPDAVRGAREARAGDDQLPRHEPLVDDLAPVVDVVDELVERADALREAALDRRPLGRGDDARHEVERERPVAHGSLGVRTGGVEGDPLLHEDRVAPAPGGGQRLGPERLQRVDQRLRVRARRAALVEHLVVEAVADGQHRSILTCTATTSDDSPRCRP